MIDQIGRFFMSIWTFLSGIVRLLTIYIPNKVDSDVPNKQIAGYYSSAGNTTPKQDVDFYWAFYNYMPITKTDRNIWRFIGIMIMKFLYALDNFLQFVFVKMFGILDLNNNQYMNGGTAEGAKTGLSPAGAGLNTWLHWGQDLGFAICIVMIMFYVMGELIAFNTSGFQKYKNLLYDLILVTFFFGALPALTSDFAHGVQAVAQDAMGDNSSNSVGDMATEIVRSHIVSIPELTIRKETAEQNALDGDKGSSAQSKAKTQAKKSNNKNSGSDASDMPPIPLNSPYLQPIKGTELYTKPSSGEQTNLDQGISSVPALHYNILTQKMSPSELYQWNGISNSPSSVYDFFDSYGTDDAVMTSGTLKEMESSSMGNFKAKMTEEANSASSKGNSANAKENRKLKKLKSHNLHKLQRIYRPTKKGIKKWNKSDYMDNGGTKGVKNKKELEADLLSNAKYNGGGNWATRAWNAIKGSTAGASGGHADSKIESNQSNQLSNTLDIFKYYIANPGAMATVQEFGQFDSLLPSFVGDAYNKYKMDWFSIWIGLIIIAAIFITYICKLISAFYKAAIMYVASGIMISKNLGNPSKVKAYIKNYFGLFEMLILDIVGIRIFFICYFGLNDFIQEVVQSNGTHVASSNPIVVDLLEAAVDITLFVASTRGVDLISRELGQPTGGGSGLIGGMFAMRTAGYGLSSAAGKIHRLGKAGAKRGYKAGKASLGNAANGIERKNMSKDGGPKNHNPKNNPKNKFGSNSNSSGGLNNPAKGKSSSGSGKGTKASSSSSLANSNHAGGTNQTSASGTKNHASSSRATNSGSGALSKNASNASNKASRANGTSGSNTGSGAGSHNGASSTAANGTGNGANLGGGADYSGAAEEAANDSSEDDSDSSDDGGSDDGDNYSTGFDNTNNGGNGDNSSDAQLGNATDTGSSNSNSHNAGGNTGTDKRSGNGINNTPQGSTNNNTNNNDAQLGRETPNEQNRQNKANRHINGTSNAKFSKQQGSPTNMTMNQRRTNGTIHGGNGSTSHQPSSKLSTPPTSTQDHNSGYQGTGNTGTNGTTNDSNNLDDVMPSGTQDIGGGYQDTGDDLGDTTPSGTQDTGGGYQDIGGTQDAGDQDAGDLGFTDADIPPAPQNDSIPEGDYDPHTMSNTTPQQPETHPNDGNALMGNSHEVRPESHPNDGNALMGNSHEVDSGADSYRRYNPTIRHYHYDNVDNVGSLGAQYQSNNDTPTIKGHYYDTRKTNFFGSKHTHNHEEQHIDFRHNHNDK